MTNTPKLFWKRFILFILIEAGIVVSTLFFWGFIGQISSHHFRSIVTATTPQQKKTLCHALNFYYDQGLAKYSKGLVLKCEPETESLIKQFSWFHRSTITFYLREDPSYHEILVASVDYFDILDDDEAEKFNSYRLESKLIYWQQKHHKQSSLTGKDKNDLLVSLVDLGVSLFVSSTSPVGLGMTAFSFLSKSGSDPAKTIPAIVVFNKIRTQNLSLSIIILTLLNSLFCCLLIRQKKPKKK